MDLTDRVALITGGKRIGAVVAAELARGGADVGLVYRTSRAEADETARAVRDAGRRTLVLQADLTSGEGCDRVVADTVRSLGRLDVLVNMASRYQARPFDDLTAADWDAQLAVDLRATWLCSRAAVPHMRRVRGGRIINFADWVAASGRPCHRAGADRRARRHVGRRVRAGRTRHPAGALGRRNRNRQGGTRAHRQRLHHWRDHPRRWRAAFEVI
jgi:NAD(P)-dependent dehydrogenase (short-subunit alcohol dehydrogenase family)